MFSTVAFTTTGSPASTRVSTSSIVTANSAGAGIEFEVLGYRLVGLDGDGSSHRNEPDGHHGDLVLSRFGASN